MNIVLVGIQGSGKGTQAKHLIERFGFVPFEMGAELRKFAEGNHPRASETHDILHAGKLVPIDIIHEVIRSAIDRLRISGSPVLFDGMPRSLEQRTIFDPIVGEYTIIFLDLDRETAEKRLSGRRVCPLTGEVFGPDFPLDHNPKNGEKLITRHDDRPEAIRQRIEIFFASTIPLVEAWKSDGSDIHTIDASDTPDRVFTKIEKIVQERIG